MAQLYLLFRNYRLFINQKKRGNSRLTEIWKDLIWLPKIEQQCYMRNNILFRNSRFAKIWKNRFGYKKFVCLGIRSLGLYENVLANENCYKKLFFEECNAFLFLFLFLSSCLF